MTRRRFTGTTADRMAGCLAQFDGTCPVCDGSITRLASQVVLRKGEWVHTSCVSGAQDGAAQARYALTIACVLVIIVPLLAAVTHLLGQPPP